jgi:hypothetical protein
MLPVLPFLAVVSCSQPNSPDPTPVNHPPAINGMWSSPTSPVNFHNYKAVIISVSANDPEGDPLSFAWAYTDGTPISGSASSISWTIPLDVENMNYIYKTYAIKVSVADSHNPTVVEGILVDIMGEGLGAMSYVPTGELRPNMTYTLLTTVEYNDSVYGSVVFRQVAHRSGQTLADVSQTVALGRGHHSGLQLQPIGPITILPGWSGGQLSIEVYMTSLDGYTQIAHLGHDWNIE